MGGAGAFLGGARSPEEILMGVLAGAMTGALNAGIHLLAEYFIGPGPDVDPYKIPDPNHPGEYLKPTNVADAAAQRHDKAYYDAGSSGVEGATKDLKVMEADKTPSTRICF